MSQLEEFSLPLGFQWSAVKAGIKASGKPDLALALCPGGASAAAMFTRNQVVAAPITIGRKHLAATGGKVTALVVNAGNANCATGKAGLDACHQSCVAVAEQAHCVFDEVFPSSTGIIGVPFPTEKMLAAVPAAFAELGSTPAHAEAFATAILTTDTKLKIAYATIELGGKQAHLFGCAKGAGMIGPNVGPTIPAPLLFHPAPKHATMLVYLFTDVAGTPAEFAEYLDVCASTSFNTISIDGDTSTNDTVLLLASGQSGLHIQAPQMRHEFGPALQQVCDSLAHAIIDDGEGVTHVVTLRISGAHSDEEAMLAARAIAHSPLCKTAWSSADPNWGRLLAAAGYSGARFDPNFTRISIAGLPVFTDGMRDLAYDEAAVHAAMSAREYTIAIHFNAGMGAAVFLACDLTHDYVSINADYST